MDELPQNEQDVAQTEFVQKIGLKAHRKLVAQQNPAQVWLGLGVMGIIGWSVVVPTLFGAALGLWLDRRHPGLHDWTLALLVAGLCLGCLNAWLWVAQQNHEMHQEKDEGHE
jgi:ATP synthase protein I